VTPSGDGRATRERGSTAPDERGILVFAPRVPEFDRSSGDLRFHHMLTMLAQRHRVELVPMDAGTSATRAYETALEDLGIGINRTFRIRELRHRPPHVAMFEFYQQAEAYLDAVRFLQPGWPAIVDSVDLHYLREARMATYESGRTTPKALQERRARELRVYANADLVLTVTEDDRQQLRRDLPGAEVAVVPNIHRPRAVLPALAERRRGSLLFVGWFVHPPNADAVLWFVREVLPQLRRVVPDVEVVIVGDSPPPEIRKLEESRGVRVTGYVPDTTPYLDAAWVSIAPLRYGAGMKGKVGEAMAAGLPVVTTSIGAEGMELKDGVTALVADTPEAFADAVRRLCTDDALHQEISARALAHVRERYDLPVVAARLEAAVKRATTLQPRRMGPAARVAFLARAARQRLAPLHSGTKRGKP